MFHVATGFSQALSPDRAAAELAGCIEPVLGGPEGVAGALILATAASGAQGPEIGPVLAECWPAAQLVGSSFEGILAGGRVWRDAPVVGAIAWGPGPVRPIPIVLEPGALTAQGDAPAHAAHLVLEAAERSRLAPEDLLLVFPDALASAGLESGLEALAMHLGGPAFAGAGASAIGGAPCLAFTEEGAEPGATIGLLLPGGAGEARLARAAGSSFASPWLEISACRERWIDALDGEAPLDWVRRQLSLGESEPVEPYLDRLLVRLREAPGEQAGAEPDEQDPDFVERYVVGLDDSRGSISVPGGFRQGGQLAFALPDPVRARSALREVLGRLSGSPVLLQFACRARDDALHGDADVESAIVAEAGGSEQAAFGTVAPFQLGPDARGRCRLHVHATVLAAFGWG